MRVLLKLVCLISILYPQAFPTPKIEYNPKTYICYKSDMPILIDGKLDDESWQNAEWTDSFVDIEGNLKPLPYFDTKAKMLWDENYFYLSLIHI